MPAIAYAINPIDFNWELVPAIKSVANMIAEQDVRRKFEGDTFNAPELPLFWDRYEEAKALATDVGWEGDVSGGDAVFLIPTDGQFDYGFVFKQSNNGDTFVVSPEPLPWLEKIAYT